MIDNHQSDPASDACRAAIESFRLEAFDNVDVSRFLAPGILRGDDVRWIGMRLMTDGRSLAAYEAGRGIMALEATMERLEPRRISERGALPTIGVSRASDWRGRDPYERG